MHNFTLIKLKVPTINWVVMKNCLNTYFMDNTGQQLCVFFSKLWGLWCDSSKYDQADSESYIICSPSYLLVFFNNIYICIMKEKE